MFALDERLRSHGLDPVFEAEQEHDHDHEHDHPHGREPDRRPALAETRPQRSLPLRQREEIQEVLRQVR